MHKIELLLNALEKVKQTGVDRWIACCPVHDDKSPSLGISIKDNKVLCGCHSCRANGVAVLNALGLSASEVFYGAEPWVFSDTNWYDKREAKNQNYLISRALTRLDITKAAIASGQKLTASEAKKANAAQKFLKERGML